MDGDDLASRVMGAQPICGTSGILLQQQPYGFPPAEIIGMPTPCIGLPTPYLPVIPPWPGLPEKEPVLPMVFPGPTPQRRIPDLLVKVPGREPRYCTEAGGKREYETEVDDNGM